MEVETTQLELQATKLKQSLIKSLRENASPDGAVSLMKLTCENITEAHLTIFVCQNLIDEFINFSTLPLVIVPNEAEISPLTLAIMLRAFYLACEEASRFLNTTPGELRDSFIRQAQRQFDGKDAGEIAAMVNAEMERMK